MEQIGRGQRKQLKRPLWPRPKTTCGSKNRRKGKKQQIVSFSEARETKTEEKQKQKKNNRSCPFRVSFSEAREKKTEARESRDQHLSRKTTNRTQKQIYKTGKKNVFKIYSTIYLILLPLALKSICSLSFKTKSID